MTSYQMLRVLKGEIGAMKANVCGWTMVAALSLRYKSKKDAGAIITMVVIMVADITIDMTMAIMTDMDMTAAITKVMA